MLYIVEMQTKILKLVSDNWKETVWDKMKKKKKITTFSYNIFKRNFLLEFGFVHADWIGF